MISSGPIAIRSHFYVLFLNNMNVRMYRCMCVCVHIYAFIVCEYLVLVLGRFNGVDTIRHGIRSESERSDFK